MSRYNWNKINKIFLPLRLTVLLSTYIVHFTYCRSLCYIFRLADKQTIFGFIHGFVALCQFSDEAMKKLIKNKKSHNILLFCILKRAVCLKKSRIIHK